MNIIHVRNVHRALPLALHVLQTLGDRQVTRNGPAWVVPQPVTTHYDRPLERVLFWAERDANPFFHFYEALWMLGGREDVASVARYAKRMATYSDDGERFHAAYGARWRRGMPSARSVGRGYGDQLVTIAEALRRNPHDRRQVLQIWDAASDLGHQGRDLPCNLTATFQACDGVLNMVVFCRSNDVVWGCYGANAVHFSTLLEYVAARAGLHVGWYEQISVNWHGYGDTFPPLAQALEQAHGSLADAAELDSPYEEDRTSTPTPHPLMQPDVDPNAWDQALTRLLGAQGYAPQGDRWPDPYFTDVALPMMRAHDAYKSLTGVARYEMALVELDRCRATDWQMAAQQWLYRRLARWQRAQDDGPADPTTAQETP